MTGFNTYLTRHGDIGAQALIEKLERYDGVIPRQGASLEERWQAVMAPAQAADWRAVA